MPIAPYDPQWRKDFERISQELSSALRKVDVLAVEHAGSTSVPGLPTKPVIDIDIVVEPETLPDALAALDLAGYRYEGEKGILGRHALIAPDDAPRRNVHVCLADSLALRNHLAMRETLRRDNALREEYARVKTVLAEYDVETMAHYVAGKNAVLQKILAAAGMSAEELEAVASANPTA